MKNLLFIALFAFLACQPEKETIVVNPELEKKAFADLNFGMSKHEYDLKVNEVYQIAGFEFWPYAEFTVDDKLYIFELTCSIGENDWYQYKDLMYSMMKLISEDYGSPVSIDENGFIEKWEYGSKQILMGIDTKNSLGLILRFGNSGLGFENEIKKQEILKKKIEDSRGLF